MIVVNITIKHLGCGGGRDAEASVVHLRAENIDYTNEFDGFWSAAVLMHIPRSSIDNVLQRINKAVKRGGFGFIAIMKFLEDGEIERVETDENGSRLFSYWTASAFEQKLREHGFELVDEVDEFTQNQRRYWLTFLVKKVA